MSVFRVNKDYNYTVMSNRHFKDNRLSLKAKGLLSEMLSLPDDWDYSLAGLVSINKEEEKAIKSALDELKDCGYVVVTKLYPKSDERTKIEYVYDIFESSIQDHQKVGLQDVELQDGGQLNTNNQILNTNSPCQHFCADEKKPKKKKKSYDHDSIPYRASRWLADEIERRLPEQKKYTEDDLQRWADVFRLMQQYDVPDWQLISNVLKFSQEDYFWQNNILSAKTFREKFTTLLAKAKQAGYV